MTGMPERIWANEIYDPDWRRMPDSVWDRDPWAGAAEYIRADIVEAKDAEIERLKAENDDMRVVMAALGKWRGHMTDNNYDAMCVAHAAYLRERESKS